MIKWLHIIYNQLYAVITFPYATANVGFGLICVREIPDKLKIYK